MIMIGITVGNEEKFNFDNFLGEKVIMVVFHLWI